MLIRSSANTQKYVTPSVFMRSAVLTAMSIKTTVFLELTVHSLIEMIIFEEHFILIFRTEEWTEVGGMRFLENVGTYLPTYTASQLRRL
jgi:hypothetical protein